MNTHLPPLPYDDRFFDLVYVISVFTHLDEDAQYQWLTELRRITKPDGIVLATVRDRYRATLSKDAPEQEGCPGFEFITSDFWKGIFPSWYQTSSHTEAYIRSNWNRDFEILAYLPLGLENSQDIVILRRS